jgi:REP element-mobilizing transposase RayT
MDNHFHIAIIPGKNSDVSKMMQRLCTGYSILFNKKYLHVGHVFQSRFKSKYIQTERGVENVLNYIANNPVKKGYSDCPENYAWLWVRDRP